MINVAPVPTTGKPAATICPAAASATACASGTSKVGRAIETSATVGALIGQPPPLLLRLSSRLFPPRPFPP
jgi:hypothetical protein